MMKKHRVNVVLLGLVALMGYSMIVKADNDEVPSPFVMIMETLNAMLQTQNELVATQNELIETQNAMLEAIGSGSSGEPKREGYYSVLTLEGTGPETYFTVPEGKQFVLLKWDARHYWDRLTLTVDDEHLIGRMPHGYSNKSSYDMPSDIPDKCIVLNAGETLKIMSSADYVSTVSTIYGYFIDAE